MNYSEFLEQVINRGIEAAKRDYNLPDQKQKRDGSVAGFEACRGKNPVDLKELLEATMTATSHAYAEDDKTNYWWYRCYEAEVTWVCNVISAMLHNQGLPTIVTPTYRGLMMAAEIIGTQENV